MTNILLIDDDLNEHKIMEAFMRLCERSSLASDYEYKFESVFSIEEAQALMKHKEYDLIFLDDRLNPYQSALQTLPKIRDKIKKARLYIISACTNSDHLQDPQNLGVDDIINKFELSNKIREGLLIQ